MEVVVAMAGLHQLWLYCITDLVPAPALALEIWDHTCRAKYKLKYKQNTGSRPSRGIRAAAMALK
jgi:hypothetical protein